MAGWWAQGGVWLCQGLPFLNKILPPAATPCFFRASLTHAPTHLAAGAIFRRPVDRGTMTTTTQRHMHSLAPRADYLANRLRAAGPMVQMPFFPTCVSRTFTGSIRANTVIWPMNPLQAARSVSTKFQGSGPDKEPKFRGVYWDQGRSKWVANVRAISFHVGCFDCPASAARHTDIAIRYLVQLKVLDEKYLARTNVSLGLLEQFERTTEETETVVKRWKEKVGREYSSVFRGVHRHSRAWESGRVCFAYFTDETGKRRPIGYFSTDIEAACAVDVALRASKLPKAEKLKRINFLRESDYLTENQARRGRCIGVSRFGAIRNYSKPWRIHGLQFARTFSTVGNSSSSARKISVRLRPYLGSYATKLEAIEVYDRFMLDEWAQQDEPRGLLPPTNFSPTRYGYELISPPTTITPLAETGAIDAPKRRGRPPKNTHSPLPGN